MTVPHYISLVRKGESLDHGGFWGYDEASLHDKQIVERGGKKWRVVATDDVAEWTRRVNHIMEHGI